MSLRIDPGRFRTRVLLERVTVTRGASGGQQRSWAVVGAMWCQVRHHSGTEQRATKAGGGIVAVSSSEFVAWHIPGITPVDRIDLGGVKYNIQHINSVDEEEVYMIITANSGANDG